ncbi:MAG: rhomboid family intramembrane serine protease [Bacteroidia bacterium]
MANPIIEDFKSKIRNGNPVVRLILINAVVFLFISLLQIIYYSTGKESSFGIVIKSIIENISFPLNFTRLIHTPWTLITNIFTHGELLPIFWNMITLYWFGKILSDYTSEKKIIPLYILGGISGALVTLALVNTIPALYIYQQGYLIGASASVTSIIIAAATLVPNVKMNIILIGPVKLIYVALFIIFIDVINVASYNNISGNLSHLGGALMGYIFIVQYKKGRDMSKGINRFFDWLSGLFKSTPRSKMNVAYKRPISDEEYNYNRKKEQEKLDHILDKISKSGYESLTKNEREILFKASKK